MKSSFATRFFVASFVWAIVVTALPAVSDDSQPTKPIAPAPIVSEVPLPLEVPKPEPLDPLYVRPLLGVEAGVNDGNPSWSSRGEFLAFERSMGDRKEIRLIWADGSPVETIYHQLSGGKGEVQLFLPGIIDETSYNSGITWSPGDDRVVFMSNGGEGNYDIYLKEVGTSTTKRLTEHKEKDGQAHWSPVGERIVFVSGRTGKGDLYLLNVGSKTLSQVTFGAKPDLYPRWSPNGQKVAFIHGSNENHDIMVVEDPLRPRETLKGLTSWSYDDLRPIWSPDGRKIAFYSNYNDAGDPKTWCIVVIAADGSDPTEGPGLVAKVVATDVVPDVEVGPAWLPGSSHIIYVKNDKQEYNPLYVADLAEKTNRPIRTDTKMNHDVSCSADGVIAFRAQVEQWDHIFVTKLK